MLGVYKKKVRLQLSCIQAEKKWSWTIIKENGIKLEVINLTLNDTAIYTSIDNEDLKTDTIFFEYLFSKQEITKWNITYTQQCV